MKILITGGNSSTALKLLKAFSNDQVKLGDYGDVPSFSAQNYQFISLGIKNEETIAHTLLNACLDEGIEMILPLHVFEIEAVAKATVLFKEFGIDVLLPTNELLTTYLTGSKTEEWLVYKNGEVVFATRVNETTKEMGKKTLLNGAFYYNVLNNSLSLITL